MSRLSIRSLLASTALIAVCSPAFAQLTGQQVLDEWTASYEKAGISMAIGEQVQAGDTLQARNVVLTIENAEVTLPWLHLRDLPDGRVEVTHHPDITAVMTGLPEGPDTVTVNISSPNSVTIIAADGEARDYTYSGDALAITSSFPADGEDTPVDLRFASAGWGGTSRQENVGSDYEISTFDIAMSTVSFAFSGTQDGESVEGASSTESVTFAGRAALSPESEDVAAMLRDGFGVNFTLTSGPGQGSVTVNEGGSETKIESSSGGGVLSFRLDGEAMGISIATTALRTVVAGGDLPFPSLTNVIGDLKIDFHLPSLPTEEPGDFTALVSLLGLQLDDFVYMMVDPGSILPRDALSLTIDLAGKIRWLGDIFSPEVAMGRDEPVEIHALTINRVNLAAAGAELTGSGDVVFDNDDRASYDGIPKPVGAVSLMLRGGESLLEKLMQMGLVDQETAMGVRMGAAMVTVPGSEPDTIVSEIEFTEDGGLLANGQRLK